MKLAFISDIHSNLHALKSVIDKINKMDIEHIFCVGDIVGYNAFPDECVDLVKKNEITCVLGNHDYGVVSDNLSIFNDMGKAGVIYSKNNLKKSNFDFLKNLAENKTFEFDGISFYMVHGSPRDNLREYVHPWVSDKVLKVFSEMVDVDVFVFGHTHVQMEAKIDDTLFLNPGSVGQPRDGISKASFMVFNTDNKKAEWYRVNYDIKAAADSIIKENLPVSTAKRLYEGK